MPEKKFDVTDVTNDIDYALNSLQINVDIPHEATNEDNRLKLIIMNAREIILNRRYISYSKRPEEFPLQFVMTSIAVAIYIYNRIGAEGEIAHSEGGISRSYKETDIPNSLLVDVTPLMEVIR